MARSDGNDLIQISPLWRKEIHNVAFLAPNGPEACPQKSKWQTMV